MVYKKGPLVGLSHQHGEIRTSALDALREVEWLRGDGSSTPRTTDRTRVLRLGGKATLPEPASLRR